MSAGTVPCDSPGAFKDVQALGGERHHFTSKDSLTAAGFNSNNAAAIRMMTNDHANTPSWGSGSAAILYRSTELALLREGKYREALQLAVDGLKAAPCSDGKYSNLQVKYYNEVVRALFLSELYFGIN